MDKSHEDDQRSVVFSSFAALLVRRVGTKRDLNRNL